MTNRFYPTPLARWTAAFLVFSTVLFALAVLTERSGESRGKPAASEQFENGEAAAPSEAGVAGEENGQAEGSHVEATKGAETIFGVNLESLWLLWGFVGISLLLALAVLRFGQPAFLLTILLAGAAALLDVREVFFQFGRANMLIAVLALLTAFAHAAAAILALKAWRALGAVSQVTSSAK